MIPALHLAGRFFDSIRPGSITAEDWIWVSGLLLPGERALWAKMRNPDQRHAVGVARAVVSQLGDQADRPVLAAALLHDVGKVECDYRTPARVVATAVWLVVPDHMAEKWRNRGKPFARLAQYRLHPQIGEELLIAAGSDQLTSSWAADHHLGLEHWRIDPAIAKVLKDCDDD